MIRNLYQIDKHRISKIEYENDPDDLGENLEYWLEIKVDDRQEILSTLEDHDFDQMILNDFIKPKKMRNIRLTSKTMVLNIPINNTKNIYQQETLTMMIRPGLLVTIVHQSNDIFSEIFGALNNNPFDLAIDLNYLVYFMVNYVLKKTAHCIQKARNEVDDLSQKLDEDPDELDISDIIDVKDNVHNLSNIVEDQYIALQSIPKLRWADGVVRIDDEIGRSIKNYSFILDLTSRLEENIKGVQSHYQLLLQERSNKKLNTLTIIQAIFVPLTLLTGIYGMNFVNMPELNMSNGYYIFLIVISVIAISELWIFWRRGWFD
ncbi:magnesium transporter CorA family protein [Flammeovirga sp. OC4]|uniref:magnesium transporter CorA family protein n=1 Tax=Flammeovirga sp. OC4 TaxID=1382345 RepID=UPI0005C471FE|nr:CorA family divalent cation transporter [Flammeovirga sp. OC4]